MLTGDSGRVSSRKKSNVRQRTTLIGLRLLPAEAADLDRKAVAAGLTRTAYLRRLIKEAS